MIRISWWGHMLKEETGVSCFRIGYNYEVLKAVIIITFHIKIYCYRAKSIIDRRILDNEVLL
jgi:hypothetical protein